MTLPPPPGDPWSTGGSWPQGGQWPQGGPWPPAPEWAAPTRTNPWSVVALVTGLIALVPVAVVAGIVALVQIGRRRESGRGMAIGGLAAAGFWTFVGVIVGIAVAFGDGFEGFDAFDGPRTVSQAGRTDVGSCLDVNDSGDSWITACGTPHDEEVYFTARLEDPRWPGQGVVEGRSDELCMEAFEGYVGADYYDSDFDYDFYAPDEREWSTGEHRVVCVITPGFRDTLVGSARRSAR